MLDQNLIFRREKEVLFQKYWSAYASMRPASPRYLLNHIDYFLAYSPNLYKDKSFVMIKNNQPVACVFLPIEEKDGKRSISIDDGFISAPIFEKQENLEEQIFDEIDRIAKEENVEKIMFSIEPSLREQYSYNFLLQHDYLDASLVSYLVDCQQISIRRNHKRSIEKILADKAFSIFVMDKSNADKQIHEQYCLLHHKCAGKITRSKETFDYQYKMLQEGNAVLVGLKFQDKFIAFTYFTFHQSSAISFSAADDPDYGHLPLYHIVNLEAMRYLQKIGVKWIDMGQPLTISNQLFYYPDEKQRNIALFKTGFGGDFRMQFRGVKYFSKSLFLQDVKLFAEKYAEGISEKK